MRTLAIETPFAVFSDVHGNLPGLEAILADIERREVPATISLGDLVGYGPSPNEVALLVRDRGIPSLMGNYDQGIGFETGDCGCVYKTDEQRAEGAVSLEWTQQAVTDEVKAYLRTLDDHFTLATPAATCSPSTAARGASTSTSSKTGRRRPWRAWPTSIPTRPSSSATRTCPTRGRSARRSSSTSAAAAGPRTATGVSATRSSTRRSCGSAGFVEFVRVPYDYERLQRELCRDAADHELRRAGAGRRDERG